MNREKWTLMDNAIDDVLKKIRAQQKNAAAIGASLEKLISVINALDSQANQVSRRRAARCWELLRVAFMSPGLRKCGGAPVT